MAHTKPHHLAASMPDNATDCLVERLLNNEASQVRVNRPHKALQRHGHFFFPQG
jgi:hypothetical protein